MYKVYILKIIILIRKYVQYIIRKYRFFFSFSVSGAAVLFVSFNHSFQPDNFLGTE